MPAVSLRGNVVNLTESPKRVAQIAERAYDLWIRSMRWILNDSRLGRPQTRGARSGWGTYVRDDARHDLWAWSEPLVLMLAHRITALEWDKVQDALNKGESPPVFLEILSDGIEHARLGDLVRATVDAAVAAESFMREAIAKGFAEPAWPRATRLH